MPSHRHLMELRASTPSGDEPASEPLQPRATTEEELHDELAAVEDARSADRLARIEADAEIVLDLQLVGFDPDTDEWKEFALVLAEYGYGVFMGWCISGVVREIAAGHANGRGVRGLSKLPEGLQLDRDDAHAVAAELIEVSIEAFRSKTLLHDNPAKRWSPTGGASLKTFFIGRCLMELPDVFEKWERRERRALHVSEGGYDTEGRQRAIEQLHDVFDGVDPLVRPMFELQDQGYSYAEIADMLSAGTGQNITIDKVRTDMSRLRTTARSSHTIT